VDGVEIGVHLSSVVPGSHACQGRCQGRTLGCFRPEKLLLYIPSMINFFPRQCKKKKRFRAAAHRTALANPSHDRVSDSDSPSFRGKTSCITPRMAKPIPSPITTENQHVSSVRQCPYKCTGLLSYLKYFSNGEKKNKRKLFLCPYHQRGKVLNVAISPCIVVKYCIQSHCFALSAC
jgi:hypothetical protein